jgi:hypothetical protein
LLIRRLVITGILIEVKICLLFTRNPLDYLKHSRRRGGDIDGEGIGFVSLTSTMPFRRSVLSTRSCSGPISRLRFSHWFYLDAEGSIRGKGGITESSVEREGERDKREGERKGQSF